MLVKFDSEADALFVSFHSLEPGEVRGARMLDDRRNVHYDHQDDPVGVEFLVVSEGINLDGVPRADEIRQALDLVAAH